MAVGRFLHQGPVMQKVFYVMTSSCDRRRSKSICNLTVLDGLFLILHVMHQDKVWSQTGGCTRGTSGKEGWALTVKRVEMHGPIVMMVKYLPDVIWGHFYWQGFTGICTWISKHVRYFTWHVITHPRPKINVGLVKPPLKSGHGGVIINQNFV